jgi:cobaltochelatase CobN
MVGLATTRSGLTSGDTTYLREIVEAFEAKGLAVLPFFNYPAHAELDRLLLDDTGNPRVSAIAALSFKLGVIPDQIIPALEVIGVPVISGIRLSADDPDTWAASDIGIGLDERSWQIGSPELAGAIAPTVVAGRVNRFEPEVGINVSVTETIPERVERWADRVARLVRLQTLPNADKKVAVMYYNYPAGKGNVGASYLNVLPDSLMEILQGLNSAGYTTGELPAAPEDLLDLVRTRGANAESQAQLDELLQASGADAVLLNIDVYRSWLENVPAALTEAITAQWGPPEDSSLIWTDDNNQSFFVLPAMRFGNILLAPQPTRGWDLDLEAAYHDTVLPPHHYYLAFYLWLQNEFQADAMVHVGTHATHEWLPGKEVGFTEADASEVMVGAVPQVYPYIVDNIGEGQQAKRRGMATIISHMTPPITQASLNPELLTLNTALTDLSLSQARGSAVAGDRLREITQMAATMGLLTDLNIVLAEQAMLSEDQIELIANHIDDIGERLVPFGLHTFGVSPDAEATMATAQAMASVRDFASESERAEFVAEMDSLLQQSGPLEMKAFLRALDGRYVSAGPGHDPISNPSSLPTGKNFFGFDPSRLPAPVTYEAGRELAEQLVQSHRDANEGEYPDRIVFNLFSVESNRHEGVQEAQILALLGVRPVWENNGRVSHMALIPREELGRPRVDVTILPSGLYRDVFGEVLLRLDEAVNLAAMAGEAYNIVAANVRTATAELIAQNVPAELAGRLAGVRIFGTPTGAYGPGIDTPINAETSWETEQEVVDVYFNRMAHMFGRGFWGEQPDQALTGQDSGRLAISLMKQAMTGADAVVHSRSSNLYATLDNDDFYQALGGAAMAVRSIDGSTPKTLVTDLSDPRGGSNVSLERYMGTEMRSRYLNPEWIDSMLDEGYAGARFVNQVVDNLWGWQVTVPEVVDAAKWQEMYEVYVEDRYDLDIRERMTQANNLEALASLVQRMQSVIDKQYWSPSAEVREQLANVEASLLSEILTRDVVPGNDGAVVQSDLAPSESAEPADPTDNAQAEQIEGRVMESLMPTAEPRAAIPNPVLLLLLLLAIGLIAVGWVRQGRAQII